MAKIYLKNKDLLHEIMESKKNDELTPKAQEMLILLGHRAIRKLKFYNPMDREDSLQTGLLDMFANWRNFDVSKSENAFAYFTEIFKRGAARGFNQNHKRKGDPDNTYVHVSLNSANEGEGIYNI